MTGRNETAVRECRAAFFSAAIGPMVPPGGLAKTVWEKRGLKRKWQVPAGILLGGDGSEHGKNGFPNGGAGDGMKPSHPVRGEQALTLRGLGRPLGFEWC